MADEGGPLGGSGKTVEIDEIFRGNNKKLGDSKAGRGYHHKMKVLTLVERGGKARSFRVPAVNAKTLKPVIQALVNTDSAIVTDQAAQYTLLGREYASHGVVRHGLSEYVCSDVHTNTFEGSSAC